MKETISCNECKRGKANVHEIPDTIDCWVASCVDCWNKTVACNSEDEAVQEWNKINTKVAKKRK